MKPGKVDLPIIWRGCDWATITLKWKDANGQPFNLTGWMPMARSQNIDFKPVITDSTGGVTTMQMNAAQTASLKLGVENWDWLWVRGNGAISAVNPPALAGKVEIKQPVPR